MRVLFVIAAAAGYGVLRVVTHGAAERRKLNLSEAPKPLLTGALDIFAISAGVGAAALAGLMDSWAAWPLGGLAATAGYMCLSALDLALIMRRMD